jgi:hypothetical protein
LYYYIQKVWLLPVRYLPTYVVSCFGNRGQEVCAYGLVVEFSVHLLGAATTCRGDLSTPDDGWQISAHVPLVALTSSGTHHINKKKTRGYSIHRYTKAARPSTPHFPHPILAVPSAPSVQQAHYKFSTAVNNLFKLAGLFWIGIKCPFVAIPSYHTTYLSCNHA